MTYTVTQEIKSQTKVAKGIYIFDFFFLLIYVSISFMLGKVFVNGLLFLPYILFSLIIAIYFVSPSSMNKRRKNYQSILLFIRQDRAVYRPVKNISKQIERGEN